MMETQLKAAIRGKKILVTGACGTVGAQIVKQLAHGGYQPAMIRCIDTNESELVLSEGDLAYVEAQFLLCDIRDAEALNRATRGVDIVFHAAAYKHVNLCERTPMEAVQTNILGVQNVIRATIENKVGRLVFTSSDKAVNPTNVMGTSKLMGERLVSASALDPHVDGAIFLSTRFGNVLGSRGSVIPIFSKQIQAGGPVTLTSSEMTRFVMSLEQASSLVIQSAVVGQPGDVLITKMPCVRIKDLAEVMVEALAPSFGFRPADIPIEEIGPKPGEKMYEELMNGEETRRSFDVGDFMVVRPAFVPDYAIDAMLYGTTSAEQVETPYNSANQPALTKDELHDMLSAAQLLRSD